MKKLLFSKIEMWLVLLLAILAAVMAIGFGALVLEHRNGSERFNFLGTVAVELASVPRNISKIVKNSDPRIALQTDGFDGLSGWVTHSPDADKVSGYILLSRFDGDSERAVVELVDLKNRKVRYSWHPDAKVLLANAKRGTVTGTGVRWNRDFFEVVHPILLKNGDLIVKDHETPLFRVDACSQPLWMVDHHVFHHSSSLDADGNIWSVTHIDPQTPGYHKSMREDGLAKVSIDGEVIIEMSSSVMIERLGLMPIAFTQGGYNIDPLHVNDIEPVLTDSLFWKTGDLFLSMRHISMIMLYRPTTDEIIWMKQGPWMGQHDVDIINNHQISVFSNNAYDRGNGGGVLGANEVMIYDFSTDTVSSPFKAALAKAQVRTLSEGLSDFTSSGHLIVEEENSGRLLIFSPDGTLVAEYINRDASGRIFTLSWSRYVDRELGDTVLAAIAAQPPCL
jgi:hypothetical protein